MLIKLPLALLVAMLPFSAYAAVVPPPQVAAVSKLYEAFAYEAVVDYPVAPGFIDESKEVLLRYITPELYELIHRDRVCSMTKHEICRLDFLPLWGNQDPMGTELKIEPGTSGNTVVARMRIGANSSQLVFTLVKTKAGWRVDDIAYDAFHTNLRKILGSK
jgi:hypothetical protein